MDEARAIGTRIHEIRTRRGKSLRVVAGLAGISASYLSRVERGERSVDKRLVLESIARALQVSPTELTGRPYLLSTEASAESHTAMATLADLLSGWWVGEVPDAPGRPLPELLTDLRQFHAARNSPGPQIAGDYATQIAVLSPLIRDLLTASADPQLRRQALAPLLTAYHVAGSIAARLGAPGLPPLAADRMRQVTDEIGDPIWAAVADWGRAHFLSATNRERQYELAVAVADQSPAARPETRGMANLTAALAAAAQGRADVAEAHLAEAADLAELIEPDVSPWPAGVMQFGRTNVGIFKVTIGVELGRGAGVAEIASAVHPGTISRGRQATFWTDYGRGLLTERKSRKRGVAALVHAEQLAPQQVHNNVFAREAVTGVMASAGPEADSPELRGLAHRMGIAG